MKTVFLGFILSVFCFIQIEAKEMKALNSKEQNIVVIAADTARGD